MDEVARVRKAVSYEAMPNELVPKSKSYMSRVEQIEAACAKLTSMITCGVYWGDARHDAVWLRAMESLAKFKSRPGTS
jgi:hypothetical protein